MGLRKIVSYLSVYIRTQVSPVYLSIVVLLTGVLTFLFYSDKSLVQSIGGGANDAFRIVNNTVLYFGALAGGFALYIPFAKDKSPFLKLNFWITVFALAGIYALSVYFYWHKEWIRDVIGGKEQIFWMRISREIGSVFLIGIPVLLWWLLIDKRKIPFYGFAKSNVKPYLILLLCFVPVIYFATFSPSFLKQYPQVKAALRVAGVEDGIALHVVIFELFYLLGFFITELFFRGFLLSVLFRKVGYAAVIPVAMFYVTIHFGKPLGETIGSFFGAIILGVIVIETKSIWGGVIVHAGIALVMEVVAGAV